MKISILKIFTLMMLSVSLQAQAEFSTKNFQGALGVQYSSLLQQRGIITYKGYQVTPIFSVQLFHPQILWAGSALYYIQPITSKNHFFRMKANFDSTLDKPLYYTEEKKHERVRRESTSELSLDYEIRSQGGSFFRTSYVQDVVAHDGFYTEIYGHLAVLDVLGKDEKSLVQIGLFSSLGGGNKDHNSYFYGTNSGGYSATNIQYGLSVTSPKVIDSYWPTLKVSRFELIGDARDGSFVKETQGWQIETLFAFRVF